MEFKGTPAPWDLNKRQDGFNIVDGDNSGFVAHVPKQDNAHLIAAAPELLSELIRLRNIVASYKQDSGDNLDITDAVIAKALGQQ
ncbi:hypothetical protein ABN057_16535 [Providencia alcalifaciens]|uniref:hypothetical protein n=1 Tax=Providencia TaxID=586 RepID=UPI002447A001|nr:hypothetical protein [Providencia rettgeri]MDH2321632.1 hypothetical protein [Providencia rettgeri]